jgi:hypothetical protein
LDSAGKGFFFTDAADFLDFGDLPGDSAGREAFERVLLLPVVFRAGFLIGVDVLIGLFCALKGPTYDDEDTLRRRRGMIQTEAGGKNAVNQMSRKRAVPDVFRTNGLAKRGRRMRYPAGKVVKSRQRHSSVAPFQCQRSFREAIGARRLISKLKHLPFLPIPRQRSCFSALRPGLTLADVPWESDGCAGNFSESV